jgi:predicted 3-demethylubiquinone-9 3-methyltransferase (glyoxalase superfamily)
MQSRFQRITPFLWFDDQAEEAAEFYISIFADSRVLTSTRYDADSAAVSGRKPGSLMTIAFELDGQPFTAINGGPIFKFSEAISLVINCTDQGEIDHYWDRLTAGGDVAAQQCGWLKDRFGLSWQVIPTQLIDLLTQPDPVKAHKATMAMLQMKKIDLAAIQRAVA